MKATGRKTEQYNFFKICNKSTNIIPGDLRHIKEEQQFRGRVQ